MRPWTDLSAKVLNDCPEAHIASREILEISIQRAKFDLSRMMIRPMLQYKSMSTEEPEHRIVERIVNEFSQDRIREDLPPIGQSEPRELGQSQKRIGRVEGWL